MNRTVVRRVDARTVIVTKPRGPAGPPGTPGTVTPQLLELLAETEAARDAAEAFSLTPGPKGDPGVNGGVGSSAGYGGLFAAASGMAIGVGITRWRTSGYDAPGIGGAEYIYDAGINALNVGVGRNEGTAFLAADGRGFRLDPLQHLVGEMFGAWPGFVSNEVRGPDNHAAVTRAAKFIAAGEYYSPTIHWNGWYYLSQTFNNHNAVHFVGRGSGVNWGSMGKMAPTRFVTPAGVRTWVNHNSNSGDNDTAIPVGYGSAGTSIYEGITFGQISKAAIPARNDAHGFHMRGTCILRNCCFYMTGGHGLYIAATAGDDGDLQGDANNWVAEHCFAHSINGDGLHVAGQDANAGYSLLFVTAGNTIGGCGIYDSCGLGSTHDAPQLTGYRNTGVHHNGHRWQFIFNDPDGIVGGEVEPGTNAAVWYDLGLQAAPTASMPAWVPGGTYYLGSPMAIFGPSNVFGGYEEHGQLIAHCPGGQIFGSNFSPSYRSNLLVGMDGFGSGLVNMGGIGSRQSTGGDVNHPAYPEIGEMAYTIVGAPQNATADLFKRHHILSHFTQADLEGAMHWEWEGKDQRLAYFNRRNIWSFGGPATERTYGRSTAQPYFFTLDDFALRDPGNTNVARIMGVRDSAPTTGNHAVGEFFFSTQPNVLGYRCEVAGTPGTWVEVSSRGGSGGAADLVDGGDFADGTPAPFVANGSAALAVVGGQLQVTSGGGFNAGVLSINGLTPGKRYRFKGSWSGNGRLDLNSHVDAGIAQFGGTGADGSANYIFVAPTTGVKIYASVVIGGGYGANGTQASFDNFSLTEATIEPAAHQIDSAAADVAALKADFNALLAKLQASGVML